MRAVEARFYEGEPAAQPTHPTLLVFPDAVTIEEFSVAVRAEEPLSVIPPWKVTESGWTSRAFDRAMNRFPERSVGIVVCGASDAERVDFFVWAQSRGAAPIILLPHKHKTRARQIQELQWPGYILRNTWIHLPYPATLGSFDPEESYPGNYSTGNWLDEQGM